MVEVFTGRRGGMFCVWIEVVGANEMSDKATSDLQLKAIMAGAFSLHDNTQVGRKSHV